MTAEGSTVRGLWRWAQAEPDRRALVEMIGRESSMNELAGVANQVVHSLRELGLNVGDGVAVLLPNGREFLSVYLAAIQGGFHFTPINYHLMPAEVAYVLGDCEAKLFIAHERFGEVAARAVEDIRFPRLQCLAVGAVEGFASFEEWVASAPSTRPPELTTGERMMYTSGTTGRPKGIRRRLPGVHPDEALAAAPMRAEVFNLLCSDDVHLVTGPLYHGSPLSIGALALHGGQTLVVMDQWSAEETLRLIETYRVATTHMVPTMFHRLLSLPDEVRSRYDLSSLKTVIHGAAPISKQLKRQMIEWFGPVLYEYFGSTEVSGTGVDSREWLDHPGTVGKPWPGVDVKIVDEHGKECAPLEPGRIFMRSPQGKLEYFKAPEKTARSVLGDFITVGDIGYLDPEGRLYPCDRATDMIISGGVNIYPAEVENVLIEHPAVGDVAVFGIPNDEWGEEVKAVVEPRAGFVGSATLEQELIEFARARIAHLKCPRSVDFRAELARAENGKLYKRLIREEYWKGRERRI